MVVITSKRSLRPIDGIGGALGVGLDVKSSNVTDNKSKTFQKSCCSALDFPSSRPYLLVMHNTMTSNEARLLGSKLARQGMTQVGAMAHAKARGLSGAALLAFKLAHSRAWFEGQAIYAVSSK